jgi:hypothetical protein
MTLPVPLWRIDREQARAIGKAQVGIAMALSLVAVPAVAMALELLRSLFESGPLADDGPYAPDIPSFLQLAAMTPALAWAYFLLAIPVIAIARREGLFGLAAITLAGAMVGAFLSAVLAALLGMPAPAMDNLALLGAVCGTVYGAVFWTILRLAVPVAFAPPQNPAAIFE